MGSFRRKSRGDPFRQKGGKQGNIPIPYPGETLHENREPSAIVMLLTSVFRQPFIFTFDVCYLPSVNFSSSFVKIDVFRKFISSFILISTTHSEWKTFSVNKSYFFFPVLFFCNFAF